MNDIQWFNYTNIQWYNVTNGFNAIMRKCDNLIMGLKRLEGWRVEKVGWLER